MPAQRPQPRSALAFALLAVAVVGCDRLPTSPPIEDSPPPTPRRVFALGTIEPAGGVISISAAPGDRLKRLDPDLAVGKPAPADGILGLMASYDTRRAQLEALDTKRELAVEKQQLDTTLAEAKLKNAEASLAQAEAKRRELQLQNQRLDYLREAADIADEDLRRLIELAAEDADLVTPHQIRRQTNRADQARKDYDIARQGYPSALAAAEATHTAAEANKSAAESGRDKLEQLNPVRAIDEEIRLARHALLQSVLLAPNVDPESIDPTKINLVARDGTPGPFTVLRVFLKRGEAVTQTPVLQLGDLNRLVCVAEVYEADVKRIAVGQGATITSDAFAEEFAEGIPGSVERISRIVAGPGLMARNPLAPIDRSVVEVRVAIDPDNAAAIEHASRWIGLQVKVSFEQAETN